MIPQSQGGRGCSYIKFSWWYRLAPEGPSLRLPCGAIRALGERSGFKPIHDLTQILGPVTETSTPERAPVFQAFYLRPTVTSEAS